MTKFTMSVICAFMAILSLQAQSTNIDNPLVQMNIKLKGGVITKMSLRAIDVNPIHEYGHFLCFDRWGPSTQEDLDLGIPFHGNASKVNWTLRNDSTGNAQERIVEMSCTLPVVKLKMERKIVLGPYSSVFRVEEEISNVGDSATVFNLVQHPTIGAPFLDEKTIVDTRVDSGFSQAGNIPPTEDDILNWPKAMVDGEDRDLRYLSGDDSWYSAVVSFILDEQEEYAWVTAVNPSLGLMVGYLWPTKDYPWLNHWMSLKDSAPFARGLEFGSTGLHQTWPEVLETDTLLGRKLYEELEVDSSTVKSYYAFLAKVPADYKGVAQVRMEEDSLIIEEYEMAADRRIALALVGSAPVGIPHHPGLKGASASLQSYPNPFSGETRIAYHLPQTSHVRLEVFNSGGQLVRTLAHGVQEAGEHQFVFHAEDLPAGVYCCSLSREGGYLQSLMVIQ